jgi:hypothetical protein
MLRFKLQAGTPLKNHLNARLTTFSVPEGYISDLNIMAFY